MGRMSLTGWIACRPKRSWRTRRPSAQLSNNWSRMATRSSAGASPLSMVRQLVRSATWLRSRSSTRPDCWRVATRMIGKAWMAPWSIQRTGTWLARVMPTFTPEELAR
ncbi:hypothetical protein D3C84_1001660 [compost metagenome]